MTRYLILTCFIAAVGGFLFGFDTSVISGAIEFIVLPEVFNLNDVAKGWTVSCIILGCMAGCIFSGKPSYLYGRKKMLIATAALFLVSTIGCTFAQSHTIFIFFRILAGVAVGSASMLSPIYIAEIAPPQYRGMMVSFNQLATFTGQALAFMSNYLLINIGGVNNWRFMLGVMMIPSLLFMVFLFFIPESPRWLVMQNQRESALKVLIKINGEKRARQELAEIIHSVENTITGKFKELFRGKMFKILIIGLMLAVFQQVTGINVIMYYAPSIFKSTGVGNETALFQTMLIGVVNLSFTILSIILVERVGRKPLMLIGSVGMAVFLTATSITFFTNSFEGYLVLIFIMGYLASFALSLGPIVWVLISEIFPNRLRSHAVSLAVVSLWAANFVVSFTFPVLLEKLEGGFTFLIYAFMCVLCFIFVQKYLTETKGKTLEQIELDLVGEG